MPIKVKNNMYWTIIGSSIASTVLLWIYVAIFYPVVFWSFIAILGAGILWGFIKNKDVLLANLKAELNKKKVKEEPVKDSKSSSG